MTEELHKAKKLLTDHRVELDNLIDRLMEQNRLTREEMASILGAADRKRGSNGTSTPCA